VLSNAGDGWQWTGLAAGLLGRLRGLLQLLLLLLLLLPAYADA
jgi:hypothetical protein